MSGNYRLSSPQEAIYVDSLLYGPTPKYNMGGFAPIRGHVDVELFKKAHRLALGVHDAFLTRLEYTPDGVMQSTGHELYPPTIIDFSDSPSAYREAIDWVMDDFKNPVPIDGYPLGADVLIKVDEELWVWYPKFHHIINDAFGHMLFTDTLTSFYNTLLAGGTPEKDILNYRDFVEDDEKYFSSPGFEKGAKFWNDKFADLPEPISFTGSKSGLSERDTLGTKRLTLSMKRYCYNDMLRICAENDITSFHFLLAVSYAYFYRTKGQDDIVIGMPILNRNNRKFRNTSGMFMSMMPLRIKIEPDWSFLELALAVSKELRASYRYQRYPLGQIIKDCRTKEGFTGNLFDITFVYRKLSYNQNFGGSPMSMFTLDTGAREESLSIEVDEYDDGDVNIFFNYNPFVIPDEEAEHLARGFEALFLDVSLGGDKALDELRIMPEKEYCAIIGSKKSIPDKRFEEIFFEQAVKTPDAEAVRCVGLGLTYKEVETLSSGIAGVLAVEYGVKPGDRVAYLSERNAVSPAVILGIFRCGGVYVPIDPVYPEERIKYILEDCGARCIVADRDLDTGGVPVYTPNITENRYENFILEGLSPEDPAYIIYTSGTTGRPKGVCIPHRGIVNTVTAQAAAWGAGAGERVLQFASLGFDASMSEIGMALLSGASLIVADRETILEPERFIRLMRHEKVSVATLPPSYLNSLEGADFPWLKTLITAGEAPIERDVHRYSSRLRYINAYGPTEISVCASWHEVPADYEGGLIPIGRAIPNGSIYILDKNLQPLPPGSVGEICVGGAGVALGYLNRDELTAEKFVPDPFFEGGRMYRTGDTGRMLPDGSLVFTGRRDAQVKIRGHRVEPEEVARTLETVEGIDSAVADALGEDGAKYLAAWYTAPEELPAEDIKRALGRKLPPYMIPSVYTHMQSFPLNASGKIDRNALPYPERDKHGGDTEKPLEGVDKTVGEIFADVLGIAVSSASANFFELGGHSLGAVRVMGRIQKEFGTKVGLKEFFASPTVGGIADIIKQRNVRMFSSIPSIKYGAERDMTASERRVWVLSRMEGGSSAYNMPLQFSIEGELDPALLSEAFTGAARRHDALRSFADPHEPIMHVAEKCVIDVKVIHTEELDLETKEETAKPFDITKPPLIRVNIFKSSEESVLSVVMHHIISDGWSLQLLIEEVLERYTALSMGDEPKLKELKADYASFASWLGDEMLSGFAARDRDYWLERFSGDIPELELPADFPRPEVMGFKGRSIHRIFESVSWKELEERAARLGATPYTLLLTAVYGLLYRYTGSRDTVIGTPVSGRLHPDVENTIGIFINTLPLRVAFSRDDSFMNLLARVKNTVAEAQDHQSCAFDAIVNELDIPRKANRQPLFDTMMILQDTVSEEMQGDGFKLKTRGLETSSSLFDMTFFFSRSGDSLRLDIEFSTELFKLSTAERTAHHLEIFLRSALNAPEKRTAFLDYIPEDELERLRGLSVGRPAQLPVLDFRNRFLENGLKHPDRPAVVTTERTVTYGELCSDAMAVCAEIVKRGFGTGDTVALMAERDEILAAGMLGILMSGASYTFMTPYHPEERLAYIAKTAGVELIIAGTDVPLSFRQMAVNCRELPRINAEPVETGDCAYYIFTSGTTGTPKGVRVSHDNLRNLVYMTELESYAGIESPVREMVSVSGAFDVSVKQVCSALACGHTLLMPHDDLVLNAELLLEYIRDKGVTLMDNSPSLLSMLISAGTCETELPALRRMLIGSEAVSSGLVEQFMNAHPDVEVVNCYGPTECTVESVKLQAERGVDYPAVLPIGTPSINTTAEILDENLNPCGTGIYGGIYLGGACVGMGYAGQSSTAFIEIDGKRVYRTGDVGRWSERGEIEFAGRSDDQVKVRGYRIEPNEVENALLNIKGVSSAAVVPFERGGMTELAGFYAGEPETTAVKDALYSLIPGYMVPAALVKLERIPLTPGGKADRKALSKMPVAAEEGRGEPLDDKYQQAVFDIWKGVLGHDDLSAEETFFEAGGNSVLLVRLHSRLQKEYPDLFRLAELFRFSTIASQADRLRLSIEGEKIRIEGIPLSDDIRETRAGGLLRLSAPMNGRANLSEGEGVATLAYLFAELYGMERAPAGSVKGDVLCWNNVDFDDAESMDGLIASVEEGLKRCLRYGDAVIEGILPVVLIGDGDMDRLAEVFGIVFKPEQSSMRAVFSERIKRDEALRMCDVYVRILDAAGKVI
ncbi:non-ribosomal peptide synthetase [Limisalsivibrio acetivorans]|uniref:non-ribosomal peptide synthetase n=1 Tax=Limisalsivibrio acetivorans TaxID=1304888 RepID=UPI0003B4FBCC|nr:non-ribosomal peptide synthetase [Limisalsivibrio acetivorans]